MEGNLEKTIDKFVREYNELVKEDYFINNLSAITLLEEVYQKIVLLYSASMLETRIINIILNFVKKCTGNKEAIVNFVEKKALKRQYHTLFDWDVNNVGRFISLFGDNFKLTYNRVRDKYDNIAEAERSFIYVGSERNKMVHRNAISYSSEFNTNELYNKHLTACKFVDAIEETMEEISKMKMLDEN